MIRVQVKNEIRQQFEHQTGFLEFGRGPKRAHRRCVIDDVFCSRDQLRIEEVDGGRLRIENLSAKNPVTFANGTILPVGDIRELDLPVSVSLGKTIIEIDLGDRDNVNPDSLLTIAQPILNDHGQATVRALRDLGESPEPEQLAHWLETIIALQRATEGPREFYQQTARTLVELVGLDQGMVLLRRGDAWEVAARHAHDPDSPIQYSRTLLKHVVEQRQTFYQDPGGWTKGTMSLADIAAVVVSPIFGLRDEVQGVLYGVRSQRAMAHAGPIRPLEAQVVQLLAAAVGANIARTLAIRTRVQFEQFFSPELVRELERDPNLLEGRSQQVTVLVSDLRGFSSLSERLGASNTCRLIRDMMERLTDRIVAHGGVIVDYAGDGILAMWNAPAAQADHAVRACTAALEMRGAMIGLNETWHEMVGAPLQLGIGLNTGPAQVGNTGSSRKFKYGPHGHTVNVASRVQDTTKKWSMPILLTESTRCLLPDSYALRRLGRVRLAGIKDAVLVYELHGLEGSADWLAQRDLYENALELFEQCQWSRSCQALLQLPELTQKDSFDAPSLKLLKRALSCLELPPEPFDAVIE